MGAFNGFSFECYTTSLVVLDNFVQTKNILSATLRKAPRVKFSEANATSKFEFKPESIRKEAQSREERKWH